MGQEMVFWKKRFASPQQGWTMRAAVAPKPERWTVVHQWERVVRFWDGVLLDVLEPGRHRNASPSRTRVVRVDLRSQDTVVPGQEVLTSDGLAVKISLIVRWSARDVEQYALAANPLAELHTTAQLALRERVAALTLEEVVARRGSLVDGMAEQIGEAVPQAGIAVHTVFLRDLMLPGEVRRAMAEAVVARESAKAALERARGEAALLRSLANTAKLLEEHPALLQLRTLQAVADSRAQVVLNAPEPRRS